MFATCSSLAAVEVVREEEGAFQIQLWCMVGSCCGCLFRGMKLVHDEGGGWVFGVVSVEVVESTKRRRGLIFRQFTEESEK